MSAFEGTRKIRSPNSDFAKGKPGMATETEFALLNQIMTCAFLYVKSFLNTHNSSKKIIIRTLNIRKSETQKRK